MPIELEQFHSGRLEKGMGYRYFIPSYINDQWTWKSPIINTLLEKASARLGELKSFAYLVPDIDLFILLHVTKEAVVTSRIEGTRTKMGEALLPEEEVNIERRNDWREVHNYINALNFAINELQNLPVSTRLIKKSHQILMTDVRGEHKSPGEFRKSQNWIGGATLDDATFIPPHHQYVHELMSDLENFLHNDDIQVPALIRIGIAHYQFETIHPFLDGNGRIGRLLITLYLVSKGILDKPLLYLSVYFEQHKNLYYDNLSKVRVNHDMEQWIKYFLIGVEQTAKKAVSTLSQVIQLKTKIEADIHKLFGKRANSALILLNSLFLEPSVTVEKAKIICGLSYKAANDLIGKMQEHNYLRELTGQSRNRRFIFQPYLNIFGDD